MSAIRNNHTASVGINVKDEAGNVSVISLEPGREVDLSKHGLEVIETPMHKARVESKLLTTDVSGEEEDQQEPAQVPGGQQSAASAQQTAPSQPAAAAKAPEPAKKDGK